MKHLISIVGPTAIGKTALSIALAKHFNTEIISADSRQIFKEMSIGTAKPTTKEMDGVKHHFIDSISIKENYTAGQFENDALATIDTIFKKNDIAIMVGGSGLYVNAVLNGFDNIPSDLKIRAELNEALKEKGLRYLQNLLKEKDPEHHKKMDIKNPQRLIRALEVCLATGKPYTHFRNTTSKERPFNIIRIGLTTDREIMYERINKRVDVMMKKGLVFEVESLIPYKSLNALQTVGYKELFDYFDKTKTIEEATTKIKQNTRNFAKRQLTWFKKDNQIKWFERNQQLDVINYITRKL